MKILLPWPPAELSPNFREHWREKHEPKVRYRGDCYMLAKSAVIKHSDTVYSKTANIPLSITFHPKTKKRPDLDNCLSWCKHGLDSVAKALGVNDKQFYPITMNYGEVVRGGCVEIEVHQ